MTLPSSVAQTAAGMGRFVALPPPFDIDGFTMSLAWHARRQDEPRHVWLRRVVVAAAADLTAAGSAAAARPPTADSYQRS